MATVPAPRTWVTGEVVTAAQLNTNISDVLSFLLTPPLLQCRQTSIQSIANSTSPGTGMGFTTEDVDNTGMHSNVTNTSRAVAVYPGWYQASGAASFAASATNGRGIYGATNGTGVPGTSAFVQASASGFTCVAARSCLVYLNVGDYWEWYAIQNSGGVLNSSVSSSEQPSMVLKWAGNA